MNIFLVEDSVSIRRLLVRRLDAMPGMRVVGEANGQDEALALINWTQPDVVLTDLSLANGSGLALLGELRRNGFTGRIAVLTSQDLDAYRRACMSAGADAFYDKASGLETLFSDLVDLLPADKPEAEEKPATLLRDGLTGLYSQDALLERMDQAARNATRDNAELAVYVLRLVGLSDMPEAQARLLTVQVAGRLRGISNDADIVARSAADQFAFVLTRVDQPDQAAAHAQQLSDAMAAPFIVDGQACQLDVELGMALFPADAVAPRSLLTLAEATAFGAL